MAKPPGLRASPSGKDRIREALEAIAVRDGVTVAEIKRRICELFNIGADTCNYFVAGNRPIGREKFIEICGYLGLRNWRGVSGTIAPSRADEPFYGRTTELAQIEGWLADTNCRMITVHGMDGVGKSSLVRKLRAEVSESFRQDVWKTFNYGESVESTLIDLLELLDIPNPSNLTDIENLKRLLLRKLQQHKHLIILEQVQAGGFREYERYRDLLNELLGEYFDGKRHLSCILLITSYEKLDGLSVRSSRGNEAKRLELKGVDEKIALEILKDREPTITTDDRATAELVDFFNGNPFALKLVGYEIIKEHSGSVRKFLKNPSVHKDIRGVIEKLIENLDQPALAILDILQNSNPISQAQIEEAYCEKMLNNDNFILALNVLKRRYLLIEYAIDREECFGLAEVTKQVVQFYLARNT
jgi:hypothetical protein